MMKKEEFEMLSKAYAPYVKQIIESNTRFYRSNDTIRWCFGYDENTAIMATYNRTTNVVTINLKSFMQAYFSKDLKTIEYYLLHEIRHVFQNSIIKDYKEGLEIPVGEDIVTKWIQEGENYVTSCDKEGNENLDYFMQDCEMDAYAFSLAVMKYKYGDVSNLYVPPVYGDEFNQILKMWMDAFKEENL